MKASIITIGDELLIGQITDTNSAWLAAELTALGFSVENLISISDSGDRIRKTAATLLPENDLLIFTGGLGPTRDDITKKELADFFGTRLVFSEEVLADVEAYIAGMGSKMNPKNKGQAMVPETAKILHNNHGTAPGMWFEQDGRVVISLPGVPREMKGIFSDYIRTDLSRHFSLPRIIYKTVMLTGIPESQLAGKLENWEISLAGDIKVAYLPSPGTIRLRLGSEGTNEKEVSARLNNEIEKLNDIVEEYIYGYDNEALESVTGRIIAERGGSLATAESCTGGNIARLVTAIPGCSEWFRGGVVAYSNDIKTGILKVCPETLKQYGAVSEETVKQMAVGAQKVFGADYTIATSGIAGPSGGTPEKPVGTVWIAAAGPDFLETKKFNFGNNRSINIERSTAAAFNLLRRAILKN